MKLKIALLAVALSLVGCQAPPGGWPVYQDGDLSYKSGTGMVYSRSSNQCRGPCDRYDNMKVERVQLGNPEDFEREQEALRRSRVAFKCQTAINGQMDALKGKYLEAYMEGGIGNTEYKKYKKQYIAFENQYYDLVNKCVDEGIK